MNTAAPTTAHKKLVGILLTIVFALTCLPAALAVDLNVEAGFYFKQSRGGTCTLASAAMMLRRRAYFDGRTDWVDVTEHSVRSTAWSNGLAHSFTYREMQVAYATLPSNNQEKTQLLIQLLAQHPEIYVLLAHIEAMQLFALEGAKKAGLPVRIAHAHNTRLPKDAKLPIKWFCKQFIPGAATDYWACGRAAGIYYFGQSAWDARGVTMRNAIDLDS